MYGEGLLLDADQKGLLHLRPRSGVILLEPLYRDLAIACYDFQHMMVSDKHITLLDLKH